MGTTTKETSIEEQDDENFDYDEDEFIPCDKCDGHPACEDFGCAYELGLGRMAKKNIPPGSDDWGQKINKYFMTEEIIVGYGNRIIAFFKEGVSKEDIEWLKSKPDSYFEDILCYHKDWNLLMSAVQKAVVRFIQWHKS